MQNMSSPSFGNAASWVYVSEDEMAERFSYPQAQSHSRESSSHSISADSSPVSLTFSSRGRLSGSTSSLSSTPPHNESSDLAVAGRKQVSSLPGVAEDPYERDTFTVRPIHPLSLQPSPVASRRGSGEYPWNRPSSFYSPRYGYDQDEYYFFDEDRVSKRRRSGESTSNTFATRIVDRFPSISRRQRKRASTTAAEARLPKSPTFLSRSSSFRKSLTGRSQDTVSSPIESHLLPSPIETIVEDESRHGLVSSPMDMLYDSDLMDEDVPEPLMRTATPLLPPLMHSLCEEEPIQSPLISPTIATPSKLTSGPVTPTAPSFGLYSESPSLTTQRSESSFARSRATTLASSTADIPPLVIADTDDEWADKLGHANFYITPEPYLPQYCDLESCKRLRNDWEIACSEFAKHLLRTEAHFGVNSRTYKLTREKWSTIDFEWKCNSERVARKAAESGAIPFPIIPIEPAPVPQLPTIDDSRLLSGYDMNIVGPMEQAKPHFQPKQSKRATIMKLFGMQSPKLGG